jgi:AcrR family transcriptional regulator
MKRSYNLGRRAERQAETRLRIVEAAIDLHGTVGPAQTTIAMLAKQAGVQRHTVYAHFPDDMSLLMACSGLALERDPLPTPDRWPETEGREQRLEAGMTELYQWYERNEGTTGCVLRDAESHEPTARIAELRFGPAMASIHTALAHGLSDAQSKMLTLMIQFASWQTLVRGLGMASSEAGRLAVSAVLRV